LYASEKADVSSIGSVISVYRGTEKLLTVDTGLKIPEVRYDKSTVFD
jgi:hypothetical protein